LQTGNDRGKKKNKKAGKTGAGGQRKKNKQKEKNHAGENKKKQKHGKRGETACFRNRSFFSGRAGRGVDFVSTTVWIGT